MASELAKAQDVPPKVTKVEAHSSPSLHKEAVVDLSSKSPTGADAKTHKPEVTKRTGKADTKVEAKPEAQSESVKTEGVKATEKDGLTTELKSAVDRSNKVIVKMPSAGSEHADVVIKPDGKIQHNLNMDPKKADSKDLTIAFEQKDATAKGLSKEQADALQKLMAYVKTQNKEFTVDAPDVPLKAGLSPVEAEKKEAEGDSAKNTATSGSNLEAPSPNRSSGNGVQASDGSSSNSGYSPRSYTGGSDRSSTYSGGDNSSTNRSYNSAPQDVRQVNMADVLTEWFTADPEKFKKLFPELYKMLVGADGKLDPSKLSKLKESNDPMLASVRESLPGLVKEFPPTKALSGGPASLSADAVNATGAVLADKAASVSSELGTYGRCAAGVTTAIERATGKTILGNANDMRETLPGHGFKEASAKDLKVGQVVHVYWTPEVYAQERAKRGDCPNYGDIAVIGKGKDGQLYAFNDHATPLNEYLQKSRYDWNTMKAFNPPTTA